MNEPGGFADLRIGAQSHGGHSDASVWPSFTDIMTVVVMIFLMALVVILLRNAELVHELRATMEAEQQSADLAKSTSAQKNELIARVDVLEARVAALLSIRARLLKNNEDLAKSKLALSGRLQVVEQARQKLATEKSDVEKQRSTLEADKESLLAQLAALGLEKQQLAKAKTESEQQLSETAIEKSQLAQQLKETTGEKATLAEQKAALEAEKQQLLAEVSALGLEKQQLVKAKAGTEQQLAAATQQSAALAADKQSLQTQVKSLGEELAQRLADSKQATAALEQQYADQQAQLQLARKRVEAAQRQLADLTENYSALEGKYEKLVGPARSELGKTVVEVRYRKINGQNTIEMRPPGGGDFQPVSRAAMDRRLSALQAKAPDKLYTRVIIPSDSGLSYDEAWQFTNDVLQRYDYYHQPQP